MSPDRTAERGFFDEASIYVRAGIRRGRGVAFSAGEVCAAGWAGRWGRGSRGQRGVAGAGEPARADGVPISSGGSSRSNGGKGEGKKRHGANGESVTVDVPCGTVAYDDRTGAVLADLVEEGQTVVVAEGGRGGLGNVHFKSARFQTPELATRGGSGQERHVRLELELLADIGLVGAPNAGKSSLLARG